MTAFAFLTATEIMFGRGQAAQAAPRIRALGTAVFLLHGQPGRADWLAHALAEQGCNVTRFVVSGEPDVAMITAATDAAKTAQVVVALGGGAVIDAGKAVAAMVPAIRPLMDHLEVIGKSLPLDHPPLPFVALPTTAGTGAEVTRNAVIGSPEHGRKVSLRDKRMLPTLAIIDPALTDNTPKNITLASGLDAITQAIEPYISTRSNRLTDALCRDAIPQGLQALRRLMVNEDAAARDDMAWVSLCGGLALANAGLGVVHGLAGPLGGLIAAPHGAICGTLLPHGLALNAARATNPARIDQVIKWIAEAFETTPENALTALTVWSRRHGLPTLSQMGFTQAHLHQAAAAAASSSSMQANPAQLSAQDLLSLMAAA
ncbi:MAG: iron-containing alcohol dehydrogenase [Cypionkella sp.]|uniref:iron-containing alcohol dehydrogenase n=1 Tax=Cypionkella sp. TaxID=2811411 RepID=UPI00260498AC|nr:iron-containing alcohol dehydrogenase [Cypionkella sp.]MDB5660185.1 iron-containing alcohol dehydrogenase [Cypionkella sp.]